MNTKGILTLLRTPDLGSALLLQRDLHTLLRVHFLYAAFDSGLLQTLRTPSTPEQIATSLQAERRDLLEGLLDLGVALGEIAQDAGRYRLRGRRARSLAKAEGDPLAALLQETVSYHGSVYQGFAARLRGGAPGDYLAGTGELVARSSRVLEPYIGGFVRSIVAPDRPLRLLEVGCGSGVYLRWAAEANPGVTGLAIDMQADVVDHARANLADWGIAGRFDVRVANILTPPADLTGPFDLATLYNNIYYFPVDARIDLFHRLRSLLTPDGALALVSTMRSHSLDSLDFDLVLRSTLGCAPLPELDELTGQLLAGGFGQVEPVQLIPGGWLYGVLARNQGAGIHPDA